MSPTSAPAGGVDVKWMDCTLCDGVDTTNDCSACGAERKLPLPGWSASMTQVPGPTELTVEPEIVHTPALEPSMLKLTGSPELAVALTV